MQYPAITVDSGAQAPVAPPPSSPKIDLGSFHVDDTVGFTDKHLRERVGTILHLNDKTASIDCEGANWQFSCSARLSTFDVELKNIARQYGLWGRLLIACK